MVDINPILSMVQQLNADQMQSIEQQTAIVNQAAKAGQQVVDLGKQALEDKQRADKVALEAEMAAQNAARAVSQKMGGQVGTPEDIISLLAQDFRENTLKAREQRAIIDRIDATDFMSNPFAWLVGQFGVNDVIDKHNSYAINADASQEAIQKIDAATSATAQAQKSTAERLTSASIQDTLTAQMHQGLAELAKVEHDNLRYNLADMRALQQGKHELLQNTAVAINAQMQAESHALSAASHALSVDRYNWEKAKYAEAKAAMDKGDDKTTDFNLGVFNAGLGALGLPPIANKDQYKAMVSNPELRNRMSVYFDIGSEKLLSGRVKFGNNPGSALYNMRIAKADSANMENAPLINYLKEVESKYVPTNPDYIAADKKEKPAKAAEIVSKIALEHANLWQRNAEYSDSQYKAPPLSVITAQIPGFSKTKLYSTVVEPLLKTGVDKANAETIVKAVNAAVDSGVMTDTEANKEIARFYGYVKAVNNIRMKFDSIGLPLQTTYNIKPGDANTFFHASNVSFDLSKESQVTKFRLLGQGLKKTLPNVTKIFDPFSVE